MAVLLYFLLHLWVSVVSIIHGDWHKSLPLVFGKNCMKALYFIVIADNLIFLICITTLRVYSVYLRNRVILSTNTSETLFGGPEDFGPDVVPKIPFFGHIFYFWTPGSAGWVL